MILSLSALLERKLGDLLHCEYVKKIWKLIAAKFSYNARNSEVLDQV